MKRILLILTACLALLPACRKKDSPAPDNGNTTKPSDTANIYTGVGRTYEQMGYTHLGRFESENGYGRAYYLNCTEIKQVGTHMEMVAMQVWDGHAAATIPVYGKFLNDSFERVSSYTGCYKQFAATSPLYTNEYRITDQGVIYNAYTRANLIVPNTFDFFLCDNNGVSEGKGLYSVVKPKVLAIGNDYYAYSVGESVISLGNPLMISKLDKVNNTWNAVDTIDYLNGYNTALDAIAGPGGKVYVCVNPMPTNNTSGKLKVYKSNGADWIKSESNVVKSLADSVLALGKTVPWNLRWIANGDQPFVAVLRDNPLVRQVTFFAYDGNQISIYNPVECSIGPGILPGNLNYVYHNNQILTAGIMISADYARTIYKVTPYSGFAPVINIPAAINRKIDRLHAENGKLYIAIKEIRGQEFFANADRHLELMDLLIQK